MRVTHNNPKWTLQVIDLAVLQGRLDQLVTFLQPRRDPSLAPDFGHLTGMTALRATFSGRAGAGACPKADPCAWGGQRKAALPAWVRPSRLGVV